LQDEPWDLSNYLFENAQHYPQYLDIADDSSIDQELGDFEGDGIAYDSDKLVRPLLRQIGEVNRRRREYLLLRDWANKRPW